MSLDASNYIKNRRKLSLTRKRIKEILVCVINSYEKIVAGNVVFDYSKRGTYKHEDYLSSILVDDYLQNELQLLNTGTTNYSVANTETKEKYVNALDGEAHPDPIDIQIIDTALKDSLGISEKIYFAIECKRILSLSSVSKYIDDTKKFTERDYTKLRLPFEGQLGFVENPSLDHISISKKINKNLLSNLEIETIKELEPHRLKDDFDASYLSLHKKKNNTAFTVFHLFFNYSNIVVK